MAPEWEELRTNVRASVELTRQLAAGPEEAFFGRDLFERHGRERSPADVQGWLNRDGPPVAVLAGPLGMGKTIYTCQFYDELEGAEPQAGPPQVVWAPLGRVRNITDDPLVDISTVLGLSNQSGRWLHEPCLRCLILDGVDEFVCRCTSDLLRRWFSRLLRDLGNKHSPRLLLAGRDVAFRARNALTEWLNEFCHHKSRRRYRSPLWLELKPWDLSLIHI